MTDRKHQGMVEAEAVEQFLRLREPVDQIRRAAEFSEWLTRSPAHVETFLAVVQTWSALDLPAEGAYSSDALIAAARAEPMTDNVVELGRAMPPQQSTRRWSISRVSQAAAAAAVLAVVSWIGYANFTAPNVFRNAGTEIQRVTLPDGSLVSLNPNSEIYLRWTSAERRLELRHGRARFQVAKNPQRPFLVDTEFGTVRAVGTIFDVDAQSRETRVTVIEGRVAVETAGSGAMRRAATARAGLPKGGDSNVDTSLQLSAGDRAKIMGEEVSETKDIAPSVVAWTTERVVFRGATLDRVIDEFNRYQSRPVIIDDSRLTSLIISGVFDPKNPDSLLSYLELFEGVKVERTSDGGVLLSSRI